MIVCFFDFCELLGIRMDVEGEIMQAESFPCQVQLFVCRCQQWRQRELGKRKANHASNDE